MATTNTPARTTFGPTVAGRFYTADSAELHDQVDSFLAAGTHAENAIPPSHRIVAIIAPHAGYAYSGPVAGYAYDAVRNADVRTVVVLAPSHHMRREAACTLDVDAYRTPIGDVPIATDVVKALLAKGGSLVRVDEDIFRPEHALDVQIPFVKLALPSAKLVPIIVPMLTEQQLDQLGALLFDVVGSDPHALVVASSDLSHFFDYDEAKRLDAQILSEITRKDEHALLDQHEARRGPCGVAPITVALTYLQKFGADGQITLLKALNSGDTSSGDRGRVVGYGALALSVNRRN